MASTSIFMYTSTKEASQAASKNSRSFHKALLVSTSFQKVPQALRRFFKFPEGSRTL
jgi:hypothetical protein